MKISLTAVNKLEVRLWWNYINQINENLKNAYLSLHVCDEKIFPNGLFRLFAVSKPINEIQPENLD